MKIIACRVGQPAQVEEIASGLEAMQAFVGGYVTCLQLEGTMYDGIDLWCHDEGLFVCQPNRLVRGTCSEQPIYGDFFIAAHDGEGDTIGLTEKQAEKWLAIAWRWPVAIQIPIMVPEML